MWRAVSKGLADCSDRLHKILLLLPLVHLQWSFNLKLIETLLNCQHEILHTNPILDCQAGVHSLGEHADCNVKY